MNKMVRSPVIRTPEKTTRLLTERCEKLHDCPLNAGDLWFTRTNKHEGFLMYSNGLSFFDYNPKRISFRVAGRDRIYNPEEVHYLAGIVQWTLGEDFMDSYGDHWFLTDLEEWRKPGELPLILVGTTQNPYAFTVYADWHEIRLFR